MAEQPAPSRFTFSEASRRYRERATGRYVPAERVRQAVDATAAASAKRMRGLGAQLQTGEISIPQFQLGMTGEIKAAHLAAGSAGRGGWVAMTQDDRLFTARQIKAQYRYLDRFAADISSGRQSVAGIPSRAEMYGEAARGTHRAMERRIAETLGGAREEKSVLGIADHCQGSDGCIGQARRGWVPIGSLIPVGARKCRSRCHCHLIFRTAEQARRARASEAA